MGKKTPEVLQKGYFFDGIASYYFGARYYDPEVGVWNSKEPAQQFWSGYRYTTNPIRYIDPDGRFVLSIAFAIGYYRTRKAGGDLGDAFKAGLWNAWGVADPGTMMALSTTVSTITNVMSNWPGTSQEGNVFKFFGKLGYDIGAGVLSGIGDGLNASTAGIFNKPIAGHNALWTGTSYNLAYNKPLFDKESIRTSYDVLSKMYYYGTSGTAIKLGGDVNWACHVNFEDYQATDDDARNRFCFDEC